MAEEQKPVVEVPKDTPATEPTTETKVEETPAATSEPTTEAAATTAEASTAAEETATPAAEEAPKVDAPIEAGSLEHKFSMFPKNFLYTKKFFWFGSEPVDTKAIGSFKADKAAEVAHHVAAWAAETGRGLLFYGEKSDKSAPHGAIQLAEVSEPVAEGTIKFHLTTTKGHKHTFKASSAAERDNWINHLKLNIAGAKELAETIKETETYKNTLASLKTAHTKKEEKAPAAAESASEEAGASAEAAKDGAESAVEEPKKEEPKRRSASRKRTSIFGLIGKKEEKHVAAAPETEAPAESSTAEATETTDAVAEPASPEATPATEAPAETKADESKLSPAKRASIFGGSFFHKKKVVSPEASATSPPSEETPASTTEAVAETAPVIPAVETSEPLSTDVSPSATAPTETVEAAAPATNGETKKEVKSEKRKSSYPFGLMGKKDKPTSDEEGAAVEKPKSPGPFSKLRATISRKTRSDKPAEEASAGDKAEDSPKPAADGAEASTSEAIKEEAVAPVVEEPVAAVPADKPVTTAPVVAPVA